MPGQTEKEKAPAIRVVPRTPQDDAARMAQFRHDWHELSEAARRAGVTEREAVEAIEKVRSEG